MLESRASSNIGERNSKTKLIESKNREKDLELKIEDLTKELYQVKTERNNLLDESFNLRQNNKLLANQLKIQIQSKYISYKARRVEKEQVSHWSISVYFSNGRPMRNLLFFKAPVHLYLLLRDGENLVDA